MDENVGEYLAWSDVLWIWRKRNRLSLTEGAKLLQTSRATLIEWENDRAVIPPTVIRLLADFVPTMPERLRAARDLAGWDSRSAAKAYGVSHVTLLRHESLGDPDLLKFYLKSIRKGG